MQQLLLDVHLQSSSLQTSTLKYWLLKETVPDHLNKNRLHPHHHAAHLANFTFHYVTVMMDTFSVFLTGMPTRDTQTLLFSVTVFPTLGTLRSVNKCYYLAASTHDYHEGTSTVFLYSTSVFSSFFLLGSLWEPAWLGEARKNPDRRAGRPPL